MTLPVIIVGPTAAGKTELGLAFCREVSGAVISADSRQVYRGLTYGTAKPGGKWQNGKYITNGVRYDLVDFLPPEDTFNSALFSSMAARSEQEITAENKTPVFLGGTGMYLQTYFSGLDALPSDKDLRARLSEDAEKHGKAALHKRLASLDPASAAAIPPGNIQRVMRALEITLLTGTPASSLRTGKFSARFSRDVFFVYLNPPKEALNERIEKRTELIFDPMVEETRALLTSGVREDAPALKSLGYPQILEFIKGALNRKEAISQIITLTRQYAKRQRTWFNRYENTLKITDISDVRAAAELLALKYAEKTNKN